MERLIRGLIDFKLDTAPTLRPHFKTLAQSQKPEVLLFACCDSRVVPHLMMSSGPGDLFEVRTVGNLIAPADEHGLSIGDVSEASAIEYALEVLNIEDIAVCGHSNCGAMRALLAGRAGLEERTPNLMKWLEHGEAAKARLLKSPFISAALSPEDRLSQANVLVQLENVRSYPEVRRRLATKTVRLHALWFDIEHTMVSLFEPEKSAYVPLDEAEVIRLLDQVTTPAGR